jgi:hypothetical protein
MCSLSELPVTVSTHLFHSLVRPILIYNWEIWNMDTYKAYYNATLRATKSNSHVDHFNFLDKNPPDKVHNKFCKYILGLKKWASNIASRSELGRLPIDCFIKTQCLLYEDCILANDTPVILKECYSLSKSFHEKGTYSWFSYVNHVRYENKINHSNEEFNKKNKNKLRKYKNAVEQEYLDIYNKKLESIDDKGKLLLFKTLKTEYKLEFYLKYPDNAIRKLICQFRVSDHSLGIERGRNYKIPRHLRLCEKCGVVDDEAHSFLYCTINDRLRTAFLDDFLYRSRIDTLNDILNPTSSQQVKSLGSFIKRSLELRTGGT